MISLISSDKTHTISGVHGDVYDRSTLFINTPHAYVITFSHANHSYTANDSSTRGKIIHAYIYTPHQHDDNIHAVLYGYKPIIPHIYMLISNILHSFIS